MEIILCSSSPMAKRLNMSMAYSDKEAWNRKNRIKQVKSVNAPSVSNSYNPESRIIRRGWNIMKKKKVFFIEAVLDVFRAGVTSLPPLLIQGISQQGAIVITRIRMNGVDVSDLWNKTT